MKLMKHISHKTKNSMLSHSIRAAVFSVSLLLLACNQVQYPDTSDLPDNLEQLIFDAKNGDVDSQFDLGVEYLTNKYIIKNPEKSFAWFEIAAKNGDVDAMYNVALSYDNGNGTQMNIDEAIKWYKKSANLGYSAAAYNLSLIYMERDGYKDSKKHLLWTKKGAELGYPLALHNLASEYLDGGHIKKDLTIAFELYKKAAFWGSTNSMLMLGDLYRDGQGASKSNVEALAWKKLGVRRSNVNSDYERIQAEVASIKKLESSMSPDELQKSKELADKYESQIKHWQP